VGVAVFKRTKEVGRVKSEVDRKRYEDESSYLHDSPDL
jgi:hypothetical protein